MTATPQFRRFALPVNNELADLIAKRKSLVDAFPEQELLQRSLAKIEASLPLGYLPASPKGCSHRHQERYDSMVLSGNLGYRPSRICIATPDIVGPVSNGGIGTAYTALARCLAKHGHDVTILFTLGDYCENGAIEDWVEHYAAEGIKFQPLPSGLGPAIFVGAKTPHETYLWLKNQSFDVIHFPEWRGTGFFIGQAKRLGLAFRDTTLCAGVHSPTLWHDLEDLRCVDKMDQLSIDALERGSVAFADVVVCPSQYLLSWLHNWGWALPLKTYVWPYVLPVEERTTHAETSKPQELVFFGRLESRKGLELFCECLTLLEHNKELPEDLSVSFLGKPGMVAGEESLSYLNEQASNWSFSWQTILDKSQLEAVAYLSSRSCLAVMPSLADNTPNVVHECLGLKIPFISTMVGGIPEMVAEADHRTVLAEPTPKALARLVAKALNEGIEPASPAVDLETVRQTWVGWHEDQVGFTAQKRAKPPPKQPEPLVSVCIATRNRPKMLLQSLASLKQQTYALFEVILVDDGSDNEEALAILADVETDFSERGWRLLREPQRYPGAARNTAAKHARGEYLLFMDDDNLALPEEIEVFVQAAQFSQIPILCCGLDGFVGEDPPALNNLLVRRWLPIGSSLPLGALTNCFGDTNMFIRRDAFFAVGGFPEEAGAGLVEDWILFSRAVLKGLEIAVVPEALFLYRLGDHGFGQNNPDHLSYYRSLQPYIKALPPEFSLGLVFAAGVSRRLDGDNQHAEAFDSIQRATPFDGRRSSPISPQQPFLRSLIEIMGLVASTFFLRQGVLGEKQHVLRQRYASAKQLFKLDLSSHQALIPGNDLQVEPASGGLMLKCEEGDPHGYLKRFEGTKADRFLVRINIISAQPTVLQLFWKTWLFPIYCETQSVMMPLQSGANECYLEIPARHLVGQLRFDPAATPGEYYLSRFEVHYESW